MYLSRKMTSASLIEIGEKFGGKDHSGPSPRPGETEILGEVCHADLSSISEPIDVVDIFRRSEDVVPIVEEAIKAGAKAIWMQEGIVNEEAAAKARKAGLTVVMDHCMKKELLRKLVGRRFTQFLTLKK
jgi:predicted CoA-binding protein